MRRRHWSIESCVVMACLVVRKALSLDAVVESVEEQRDMMSGECFRLIPAGVPFTGLHNEYILIQCEHCSDNMEISAS